MRLSAVRLYGVTAVEAHDAHGTAPLAPPAELLVVRELAAVVSDTPFARPALAGDDLAAYGQVVEQVFAERAILPAPAGVVFRNRDALRRWLELHYVTLSDGLAFIEGRAAARVHVATPVPEKAPAAAPAGQDGGAAALAGEAFRVLRRHAVSSVTLRAEADGDQVASFLVDRERWRVFADAVAEEGRRDGGATLRLTGPWPPYDFVRMQFGG